MSRFRLVSIILTLFLLLGFVLYCNTSEKQAESTDLNLSKPDSSATILENIEKYFSNAINFVKKMDRQAAADEIRKAASVFKIEVHKVPTAAEESLQSMIDDLDTLATNIENGTVTKANDVENSIANAYLKAAKFYQQQALDLWAQKKYQEAGEKLRIASNYLKRSANWAGEKAAKGFTSTLDKARALANKLIKSVGGVTEDIGEEIQDIGKEIKNLNNKIQNNKKEAEK